MKYGIFTCDADGDNPRQVNEPCYLDGYSIAERQLEGVMIKYSIEPDQTIKVEMKDPTDANELMTVYMIVKVATDYLTDSDHYVDGVHTLSGEEVFIIGEGSHEYQEMMASLKGN